MLIHLTPRFYTCELSGPNVELVDLQIPELRLVLSGGKDLATRRPYVNKRYVIGCRNIGTKAIAGILVETPTAHVPEYTVVTRWAVDAEVVVTHRVQHLVLDRDFDTVTDSMVMWYAKCESLGGWRSRWPQEHRGAVPVSAQPRMQLSCAPERTGIVADHAPEGFIAERAETFSVPTIERARLLGRCVVGERIPSIESVFKAG